MPKLLNFRFPKGWYFLKCDNTELKRSSLIFFFCFRTALLGGSRLNVPVDHWHVHFNAFAYKSVWVLCLIIGPKFWHESRSGGTSKYSNMHSIEQHINKIWARDSWWVIPIFNSVIHMLMSWTSMSRRTLYQDRNRGCDASQNFKEEILYEK